MIAKRPAPAQRRVVSELRQDRAPVSNNVPPGMRRERRMAMRKYEDRVRPSVVLRRIIIVVAVLTAVPVALWTVTAFVRAYVAPPKLPTFRQLATNVTEQQESTGSTTAAGDQSLWQSVTTFVRAHVAGPQISSVRQLAEMLTGNSGATSPKGDANSPAAEQARPSASSSMTVEARATATDARDLPGSSKEQSANGDNMPASMAKMVDAPPTSMASKSTDMPVARAADMTAPNAWPPPPQQNATPQTNAPWPPAPQPSAMQLAAQPNATEQAPAAGAPLADAMAAGQPLTGRIPLPRRRPNDLTMVQITAANVPMPRPRPDIAGSAAPPEAAAAATSARPLEFLDSLFH